MASINSRSERGFTIVEVAIVVLISATVAAFATPQIVSAMRNYRLNVGARAVSDAVNRAKMLAVSENRRAGIALDPARQQVGVVIYNDDGTVNRIEYRPLPSDITFQRPSDSVSNPTGVTGSDVVSFAAQGGVHRLDFSSRGMPINAWGTTESIFIGNGFDYRVLTLTSVGNLRGYRLEEGTWVDTSSSSSY
jgi:prepilin-type N-terminal cleavage/methylation domain-containing protein